MMLSKLNLKKKKLLQMSLGDKIGNAFSKQQGRIADYLNRCSAALPLWKIKLLLFVFCIAFGGTSICILIHSFHSSQATVGLSLIQHSPKYIGKPELESQLRRPTISKKEIVRIEHFKKYMDSLSVSQSGRIVRDSLLKYRSGLIDSLNSVEQLYNH